MTIVELSEQVIQKANIIDIVGEVVELKAIKGGHWGLCPFHDDNHASMSVINRDDKKMFNCFSCGAKGNVVTFYQKYYNIPFSEAVLRLAKKLNIEVDESFLRASNQNDKYYKIMDEASKFYSFYLNNSTFSEKALEYLKNRGIDEGIINEFKVGLAPDGMDDLYQTLIKEKVQELDQIELGLVNLGKQNKPYDIFRNRIMFPILDEFGKVIGFSGRIYGPSDEPKYVNSKETKIFKKGSVLYNFSRAQKFVREGEPLFIFEGFMDVIAAYKANVKTGVASMGTAFTDEHAKKILGLTNKIVLCFDGDDAGIKALQKTMKVFSHFNYIPDAIIIPNNMDPDEYLQKFGRDALKDLLLNHHKNCFEVMYDFAESSLDKNSIISIEKYKLNVFGLLEGIEQSTTIDFYLNKVADKLGMELNKIQNDYEQFVGSAQSRILEERNYNTENKTQNISKPVKSIVGKKHYLAMEGILAEMFKDRNRFYTYYDIMGEYTFYICKELSLYTSIIDRINVFYNEITDIPLQRLSIVNAKQLFENENSSEYKLCDKVFNGMFFKAKSNELAFKQNIECIQKLIKDIDNEKIYDDLNSKDQKTSIDDFIKTKSKNTKFVRK